MISMLKHEIYLISPIVIILIGIVFMGYAYVKSISYKYGLVIFGLGIVLLLFRGKEESPKS